MSDALEGCVPYAQSVERALTCLGKRALVPNMRWNYTSNSALCSKASTNMIRNGFIYNVDHYEF